MATASAPLSEPATTSRELDPLPGKSILVVDDDALVLEATRGLLENWGCLVVAARSGTEALEKLSAAPDLIITDFRLADGRTGTDVVGQVHSAYHPAIPAIFVSGDVEWPVASEASDRSHTFLRKPLSPMTLRATMSRYLKAKALV